METFQPAPEGILIMTCLDLQSLLHLWSALRFATSSVLQSCAWCMPSLAWHCMRLLLRWLEGGALGATAIANLLRHAETLQGPLRRARCSAKWALSTLAVTRTRLIFQSLLAEKRLFDAELSMAGIFEISTGAQARLLEGLQQAPLALLPAVLTDEGCALRPERLNWSDWKEFLAHCPCFWLNTTAEALWSSVECFGHGDSVELSWEVSHSQVPSLCHFGGGESGRLFETAAGRQDLTVSLWISSSDLSAHLHFTREGWPLRLNCIVLGSDMRAMNFFGSMGRVAVEPGECPVAEALLVGQRSLVKRAATESFETLAADARDFLRQCGEV
ncbi:unnamed protein product [Effrenium voratum]|nr:unnamed protein product [Effrenium voratum]CAJ1462272.1 unnamed protein product [Effrenium voratum]